MLDKSTYDLYTAVVLCSSYSTAMQLNLPMSIIFYHTSAQHTAPQVHFLAVLQCSSWCSDENMSTTIHCNADAVECE